MQKSTLVNADLLDFYINKSGLKISYICDTLGISRQAFDRKRKGQSAFKAVEVFALCVLLGIDNVTEKSKIFCPKC